MERGVPQRARLAHQKYVAAFQVAMRIAPRPLQCKAPGNDAVNDVPQRSGVHAAAPGNPGLERVARVKISDIPRARVGHPEGVDARQVAAPFAVGLLELLDPFEEHLAPLLIERVVRLSLLWLAAMWRITFNGVQPAAARTAFPRLPDGRDVTALVPGRDRLADCFVVTKSWHNALRRSVTAHHPKYTKRSQCLSAIEPQNSLCPLCLSGQNNHGDTESTEKAQTCRTPFGSDLQI